MTGNDLYERVMNLLGYVGNYDSITEDSVLYKRTLHVINQVLIDLKQEEISDMNCTLNMSGAHIEALIYGVAMMLSLIGGDGNLNRIFTDIYNSKRSGVLCETDTVTDLLPTPVEGED